MDINLIKEIQKEVLDYNKFVGTEGNLHITLSLSSEIGYLYVDTQSDSGLFNLEQEEALEEALRFVKEAIGHDEEYMEHLHELDKIDVINDIRGLA